MQNTPFDIRCNLQVSYIEWRSDKTVGLAPRLDSVQIEQPLVASLPIIHDINKLPPPNSTRIKY